MILNAIKVKLLTAHDTSMIQLQACEVYQLHYPPFSLFLLRLSRTYFRVELRLTHHSELRDDVAARFNHQLLCKMKIQLK